MAAALNQRGVGGAWRREWRYLRGNRWELALVTVLPLAMLVVMAWMFSASVMRDLPIAVVDLDNSPDSRHLLRMLDASPGVAIATRPASLPEAMAQARALQVNAVVLIPRDVTRQLRRAEAGTVIAYYNASYLASGQSAMRDIAEAVTAFNARLMTEQVALQRGPTKVRAAPVAVQSNILYNPARSYELFLLSLIFPALLSLVATLAMTGALGRELRDATLAQWLAPGLWPALCGKLAPYVLLFSLYGVLGIVYLAGVRGDGVAGSWLLLVLGQLLLNLSSAGIALLFVAGSRDMGTALSLVGLGIGTSLAFSGATFPIIDAPLFTRVWNHLLPLTGYVQLQMQQWFVGAPARVSLSPLLTLVAITLVAGGVGVLLLRRIAPKVSS